jgi:hypothetical protein
MNQSPDSAQKDTQKPSRMLLIRLVAGGIALVLVLAGLVYISKRPAATPEPRPSTVSSSTQTTTDIGSGPCTGSDAYTLQGDTIFYHTHTGLCVPIRDVDRPSFVALSKQGCTKPSPASQDKIAGMHPSTRQQIPSSAPAMIR